MVDADRLGLVLANRRQPIAPLSVGARPQTGLRVLRPRNVIPVTAVPHQAQQKHRNRSLWEQVSDAFTGIPAGLASLAKLGAEQLDAPARIVNDLASGRLAPGQLPGVLGTTVMPWQVEEWGAGKDYFPISQQFGRSFGTTALRLRHPTQYARAVKEGRIVDAVLEDAGNLSIAGSAASKVAGAAAEASAAAGSARLASGLGRAATGLERGAAVLDKLSNLPVTVPTRGARGLVRAGIRVAEDVAPETMGRMRSIAAERGFANAMGRAAQRARARVGRDLHEVISRGEEMSLPEQGAVIALLNKVGDVDKAIVDRLAAQGANPSVLAETTRQAHVFRDIPEHSYTPEIQQLVHQYLDGTLDPEVRARIDAGLDVVREKLGEATDRALNGVGRLKGNLDPQQLGNEAIDQYVINALQDEFNWSPAMVQQVVDIMRNQLGMSWEDIGQYDPDVDLLLDSPDVYPAAWRPAMRSALLANEAFPSLGMPVRPEGLRGIGIDQPNYIPGGESDIVNPRSLREGKQLARSGFGGLKTVASEHQRISNEVGPYSFRTLADMLGDEVSRTEFNRGVMEWAERHATNRANTVLDQSYINDLRTRAHAEAAAQRGTPGQIRARAQLIFARDLVDALDQEGYEVLQGDLANPKTGDFNPDAKVDLASLNDDVIVLPKGMKQALTQNWVSKDLSRVLRALEKGNSFWKRNALPFSIRWQVGDMVGGMFMSWVGGGVPPWELINSMGKLEDLGPDAMRMFQENVVDHPEFVDAGLNAQELQWMRGEGGPTGKPARTSVGRGYDAVRRKSFELNQAINRFSRHRFVLAKLQRELDKVGLSLDDIGGDPQKWADPKVQKAIDAAVTDANKVIGTFDELTPVEQRVVKNLFPFWVWQRHITQLAWRTAVDNPARMLWTLRLGSYGTQQQQDMPAFLKGGITIGNRILPLQWANPWNDVAEGSIISSPAKSLSPVLKLGAAAGGINLNTMRPFSRPYGSGNTDPDTGGDRWTPLMWPFVQGGFRPGEFAYVASQMLPLSKAALDLAPTGELGGVGLGPHTRYQQGTMMVDKRGRPISDTNRLIPLAQMVGLPVPRYTLSDAANIMGTGRKRSAVRSLQVRKVNTGLGG